MNTQKTILEKFKRLFWKDVYEDIFFAQTETDYGFLVKIAEDKRHKYKALMMNKKSFDLAQ